MEYLTFVCLANSRKHGGKCVAGFDINNHCWVRPVSDAKTGELKVKDIKYSDEMSPKVLDIIRIPIKQQEPKSYQPENLIVGDGQWQKIGALDRKVLDSLCSDADTIWDNKNPDENRVSLKYIEEQDWQSSLLLIKVKTLMVRRKDKITDGEIKERLFAKFTFNGIDYELPVTDPNIEKRFNAKKPGIYPVRSDENYLCISLGEPYMGNCYKLVATILSFDPKRPSKVKAVATPVIIDKMPTQIEVDENTEEEKHTEHISKNDLIMIIYDTLESLDFDVGRSYITDILKGSKSTKMNNLDLKMIKYYGILSHYTGKQVLQIIDELIEERYFEIKKSNIAGFPKPFLYKTGKSDDLQKNTLNWYSNEEKVNELNEFYNLYPRAYDKWTEGDEKKLEDLFKEGIAISKISEQLGRQPSTIHNKLKKLNLKAESEIMLNGSHKEAYEELRIWRNEKANELNIPAYFLSNNALKNAATSNVKDKYNLLRVKGFGEITVENYGDDILKILLKYNIPDTPEVNK